jgi:hypothetical protein
LGVKSSALYGVFFPKRGEKMARTIEEYYERLRVRAQVLRQIQAGTEGSIFNYESLRSIAYRQWIDTATQRAIDDWPRVRRAVAEAGDAMPEGPVRFGTNGYSYTKCHLGSVCISRSLVEQEKDYAQEALEELMAGAFLSAADAAADEFECYRRAVAQGVAVSPQEDCSPPEGAP